MINQHTLPHIAYLAYIKSRFMTSEAHDYYLGSSAVEILPTCWCASSI